MYKVLVNNTVVGVLKNPTFARYQRKNQRLIACEEILAQFVLSEDGETVWHIEGRSAVPVEGYDEATLLGIDEDEYNKLKSLFDEGKDAAEEPQAQEETVDIAQATLVGAQNAKIKAMSKACSETIINGIDIVLSDKKSHHFDLTLEDQINLLTLKSALDFDDNEIAYHSANELFKFYSYEDIETIIELTEKFKNYHTVYFNSLKNYIKGLESVDAVSAIEYGCEIPLEYQSDVLKALLQE